MTQPTITMQIQKLEDEIGVKLFDRNSKPLSITPAGEQILMRAREILRDVDQLKAFVSEEKESLKGSFSLGVIPTIAPYLLPILLPRFVKKFPDTHLVVEELQTHQIIRRLKEGSLDIGLLSTPLEERQIREVALYNEPFLLYRNPLTHPEWQNEVLTGDLDYSHLLLLHEGHCFRDQTLNICRQAEDSSSLGFEYASGSIEGLKSLVRQGVGLTLVPEMAVNPAMDKEFTVPFAQPLPVREVGLAVHNSFTKEALIEALRDEIQEAIPKAFTRFSHFTRIKWR